jgi:thiol-disulfide isomerase/thioredoxin
VLVYATWCPKCNSWSADFFSQVKAAVKDKPVVVLAVDSESKQEANFMKYVTERGFLATNIFHGQDPTIAKRLGFESNLFKHVLIGPDGTVADKGDCGSFYNQPNGKQFVLAKQLADAKDLGRFTFLKAEMSDEVKAILWPLELGAPSSDAMLSKARKNLGGNDQEQLDAAIGSYLNDQMEQIRESAKGDVLARLGAYEKASALSVSFKKTEQGKAAKELLETLGDDADFKREVAAKIAYEKCMQQTGKRRSTLLKAVATRFEGTHYGALAQEARKAKSE